MTEPDPFEATRMSLGEHLEELRRRLFRGILAVAVAFFLGWSIYPRISDVVLAPMYRVLEWIDTDQVEKFEKVLVASPGMPRTHYFLTADPVDQELRPEYTVPKRGLTTGFGEGFWFALRISLYFALVTGAPFLLWQLWGFIAAGLYPKERRAVLTSFPASVGLFAAGVLFGYFLMVPYGFYYLAGAFPPEEVEFRPRLSEYLSLMTSLTLALGAVFQLPLLMYVLVRIDLVPRATFVRYRPHFYVGAFVLAGILTPPDIVTQLLMAGPVILLFEIGILTSRFARRPASAPTG